jgi:hypothetical protein
MLTSAVRQEETRNLLESGGTDGSFQRPEEPLVTDIVCRDGEWLGVGAPKATNSRRFLKNTPDCKDLPG